MALKLVLGVDAGLSSVKVVGPKGELDFQSITILEPEMMKFGNSLSIQDRFELTINDENYILGEHARFVEQFNPEGFDGRGTSGTKSDETAFIRAIGGICHYIDKYEKYDDEDIDVYLAYGSPILDAVNEEEVAEIEARFKNGGRPHSIYYNDIPLNIRIKDIIVLPEGAAAFYSTDFQSQSVYIADAGSQTINLAALVNGIPVPTGADTVPNGVEYFKKMYSKRPAEMLAKKVKSTAERMKWPKGAIVHACGGYAFQLAEAFNEISPNKYTMEILRPELPIGRKSKSLDPIYANAAGLYFIAKEAFATTVKG